MSSKVSDLPIAVPELTDLLLLSREDIGNYKISIAAFSGYLEDSGLMARSIEVDEIDSTTMYIGRAAPGSATNAAVWSIQKIITSGGDISIKWADGNSNYDNVWDDRLSLTYLP